MDNDEITMLSLPLKGKLAIVTGASRGIGVVIAETLFSKGASLLLNYTSDSSYTDISVIKKCLDETDNPNTCGPEGQQLQRVEIFQADMGSLQGPKELVCFAVEKFGDGAGGLRIDVVVNNAGVSVNEVLGAVTAEGFDYQYYVNVRGPLLLIQAAMPYLPHDRSGRIINLSSVSAKLGLVGQSVYGGTKAALEAMTRTWSRELAGRATVNAVNPGPVDTDMYNRSSDSFRLSLKPFLQTTPLSQLSEREKASMRVAKIKQIKEDGGKSADESDIAGVVLMLCLPEAGWTTGSVVCANGGMVFGL